MTLPRTQTPGWPEFSTALLSYLALLMLIAILLFSIPEDQAALRGIVGMGVNGVAGILSFHSAYVLRIRNFRAFGFRVVDWRWLLISVGIGLAAVPCSMLIEHVYFSFITEPNTQADFQAAAQAGIPSLLALIFAGALLTPFGEEVVFRGVIANSLNRYGIWPGVVGSAAIFGIAHGLSVIFFNAFFVGILTGLLFRKTQSIWPGVVVHIVFNGAWLIVYSFQ